MADPQPLPPSERALWVLDRLTSALGDQSEDRPGQHRMTEAIAEAVSTGRHVVVQAGTGTGKSLAYLAATVGLGKRTVIATATKALQDQLATKELPHLTEHLGRPVTWAILKGRSNYLCRQRLDEISDPAQQKLEGLETLPDKELTAIRAFEATTTSGDRADMSIEPSVATWSAVSVGPRECPGAARCPRGDDCFAENARRRAAAADVIVVNTHLYGLHLATGHGLLPPHDVVVFDEAHELPDVLSATCGLELTPGRFAAVSRVAGAVLAEDVMVEGIETIGQRIDAALAPFAGERLRDGLPAPVIDLIATARSRLAEVMEAARRIDAGAKADVATKVARLQISASSLSDELATLTRPPDGAVLWVESDRDNVRLRMAPLDVGETLDQLLWNAPTTGLEIADGVLGSADEDDPHAGLPDSVVLTSATIASALDRQLHLPPDDTEVLDVGSPFDFEHQALLYCAAHLPDPRADGYTDALIDELATLIGLASGRTLALFTSRRVLQLAADALRDRLPYTVLVQGDQPKRVLVERFTEDESSCLFATMGYWQGIDVPGRALSLVTLDRLPFPRPDEPLWQARREAAGPRAFEMIDVPRAATLLAQGAGRLIRRRDDRGVVAVLDPRLATAKRYRWQLLEALPPMPRTRDLADVERFFQLE